MNIIRLNFTTKTIYLWWNWVVDQLLLLTFCEIEWIFRPNEIEWCDQWMLNWRGEMKLLLTLWCWFKRNGMTVVLKMKVCCCIIWLWKPATDWERIVGKVVPVLMLMSAQAHGYHSVGLVNNIFASVIRQYHDVNVLGFFYVWQVHLGE